MNLRASEVASLPFPVFRLMSIPSELISPLRERIQDDNSWHCSRRSSRSFCEVFFFSTEQPQNGYGRKNLLQNKKKKKPTISLQSACATILNDASAEILGQIWSHPFFPFVEVTWVGSSHPSAPKLPNAYQSLCYYQALAKGSYQHKSWIWERYFASEAFGVTQKIRALPQLIAFHSTDCQSLNDFQILI